jgi:hypothetical protein
MRNPLAVSPTRPHLTTPLLSPLFLLPLVSSSSLCKFPQPHHHPTPRHKPIIALEVLLPLVFNIPKSWDARVLSPSPLDRTRLTKYSPNQRHPSMKAAGDPAQTLKLILPSIPPQPMPNLRWFPLKSIHLMDAPSKIPKNHKHTRTQTHNSAPRHRPSQNLSQTPRHHSPRQLKTRPSSITSKYLSNLSLQLKLPPP